MIIVFSYQEWMKTSLAFSIVEILHNPKYNLKFEEYYRQAIL